MRGCLAGLLTLALLFGSASAAHAAGNGETVGVAAGDYVVTVAVSAATATRARVEQQRAGQTAWERIGEYGVAAASETLEAYARVSGPDDRLRVVATDGTALTVGTLALAAAPSPFGALVRGRHLVDQAGAPLMLRGLDAGGYANSPTGNNLPPGSEAGLRSTGADIVRVEINEIWWLPFYDAYDPAFRQRVIDWTQALLDQGLTVIVDLHWSGQDDPQARWINGVTSQGWLRAPGQQSLAFWRDAASVPQWKNHPRVLFELYNEPKLAAGVPGDRILWRDGGVVSAPAASTDGATTATWETPGHQALYDAIRAQGARNVVLADGMNWAGDLVTPLTHVPLDGTNLAYAAHAYPDASETAATYPPHMDTLVDPAIRPPHSHAVVGTEFGSSKRCNDRFPTIELLNPGAAQLRSEIDWWNARQISWVAFGYMPWDGCDKLAFGLLKSWAPTWNARGLPVAEALAAG